MAISDLIQETIAQHIVQPKVLSYAPSKLNEVQGRFVAANRVYNFVLDKSGVSYSPAGQGDSLLFSGLYLQRLDAARKPKIGNDRCNAGKSYQCGKICLGNRRKCHKGVRDVNDARRIASILESTNEKLKGDLEGSDKAIARGSALFEARGNRAVNGKVEATIATSDINDPNHYRKLMRGYAEKIKNTRKTDDTAALEKAYKSVNKIGEKHSLAFVEAEKIAQQNLKDANTSGDGYAVNKARHEKENLHQNYIHEKNVEYHALGTDGLKFIEDSIKNKPLPEHPKDFKFYEASIPFEETTRGYGGYLRSPEGATIGDQRHYVDFMNNLRDKSLSLLPEGREKDLTNALNEVKDRYISLNRSKANTGAYSAMIAGGSKFNSKQAERRGNSLDKANNSLSQFLEYSAENTIDKATGIDKVKQDLADKATKQKQEKQANTANGVAKFQSQAASYLKATLKKGDKVEGRFGETITVKRVNPTSVTSEYTGEQTKLEHIKPMENGKAVDSREYIRRVREHAEKTKDDPVKEAKPKKIVDENEPRKRTYQGKDAIGIKGSRHIARNLHDPDFPDHNWMIQDSKTGDPVTRVKEKDRDNWLKENQQAGYIKSNEKYFPPYVHPLARE